jgi:hypothetical protein
MRGNLCVGWTVRGGRVGPHGMRRRKEIGPVQCRGARRKKKNAAQKKKANSPRRRSWAGLCPPARRRRPRQLQARRRTGVRLGMCAGGCVFVRGGTLEKKEPFDGAHGRAPFLEGGGSAPRQGRGGPGHCTPTSSRERALRDNAARRQDLPISIWPCPRRACRRRRRRRRRRWPCAAPPRPRPARRARRGRPAAPRPGGR